MYKKSNRIICMGLMLCMTSAMVLGGCGQKSENSGKIEIELVQYKPEAVKTFEKIEEEFNATHDDIHLTFYQRRRSGYYRNRWRCQFL